ncbi:hypothetical protein L3i20_v209140 [Paenibacillus sp. L3-i20]|nr:hypothetical protein L3i20_v209140 [Paenibacillus sp. L3-i20]
MIIWLLIGSLSVLALGSLPLIRMKRKINAIEWQIASAASAEEAWSAAPNITILSVHYAHPSFKKLDELLSTKHRAFQDVIVFLDAPAFIILLKQRAWSSCRSVRNKAECHDSKWLMLLNEESIAYQWNGIALNRYTEVEMFVERKMMIFHPKEEAELCTQQ